MERPRRLLLTHPQLKPDSPLPGPYPAWGLSQLKAGQWGLSRLFSASPALGGRTSTYEAQAPQEGVSGVWSFLLPRPGSPPTYFSAFKRSFGPAWVPEELGDFREPSTADLSEGNVKVSACLSSTFLIVASFPHLLSSLYSSSSDIFLGKRKPRGHDHRACSNIETYNY